MPDVDVTSDDTLTVASETVSTSKFVESSTPDKGTPTIGASEGSVPSTPNFGKSLP